MTEPLRPEHLDKRRRDPAAPETRWQSSAKWTLVAVALVVVVGGGGFYWLVLS
ncbi:hypothetical protein [Rhabdothermincola salaria]|uniref:hypothetical protein n=1 Tax=Rhabdothermincola salaria TaxID=2903142 RepID=UPI001E4BDC9D|nr:hypothetical protein [Rhabdothermincola salaria]MCD9623482.1 hypothetical protein [Rhabdothermincola salaria]